MKRVVENRVVGGFVITILNIRKDIILCAWIFIILHPQDMNNHPVDYLSFSIILWVKGSRFGQVGVHNQPQDGPKSTQEPVALI
jgi:hypothetical protein